MCKVYRLQRPCKQSCFANHLLNHFTLSLGPGMSPLNVSVRATLYHAVMVTWDHVPPAYSHGYIEGYIVFYQKGNHSNVTSFNDSQIASKPFLEITHLDIFSWYSFQVVAFTTAGLGVKSEVVHARTLQWGKPL